MIEAAQQGHLAVVRYLASERGAAIEAQDAAGRTALTLARPQKDQMGQFPHRLWHERLVRTYVRQRLHHPHLGGTPRPDCALPGGAMQSAHFSSGSARAALEGHGLARPKEWVASGRQRTYVLVCLDLARRAGCT